MTSPLLENVSLGDSQSTAEVKPVKTASKPRRSWKNFQYRQDGKRAYICKYKDCMKIFNHLSSLIKHERIHRGERPYTCKVCNQKFVQSSNLRRHEKTHTGEKLFACSQCDKKFSTASNLRQHVQIHNEETMRKHYECKNCGRSYLYLSSLNKHVKYCNKEDLSSDSAGNMELSRKIPEEPALMKHVKLEMKIEDTLNDSLKTVQAETQLELKSQLNFTHSLPVIPNKMPSYTALSMMSYLAKPNTSFTCNTVAATTLPMPQLIQQPVIHPLLTTRNQLFQDLSFQPTTTLIASQFNPITKMSLAGSMMSPSLCSVNYPDISLLMYQKQKLQEYSLQKRNLGLDLTKVSFY